MKKILVPTDFSSCAANALNYAVQTAKLFSLEINLLHVVDVTDRLFSEDEEVIPEKYSALLIEAQKKLDQTKASIAETESLEIRTFLREGEVDEHILSLSEEKDVDLIVMGTFGINGLKDRIWGSKTAGLTGKTKVPVMVIPYEYDWNPPHKALLATNQFEEDHKVLEHIRRLIGIFKLELHVVVFTDEDSADASLYMENSMNIAGYGKILQKELQTGSVVTSHLSGHRFEDTLQDYISENDIDMVAMITYQRSVWDRIFHPSTTRRMSYHTTVPLLVIPAGKEE
ncbi:MAG: universal stress protein [Chitinophagaceae bacterium]|nr:universal stress protein [Chitinophagaceae bacterium]